MAKYRVTGRVARIPSGVIEITEEQASVREHQLERVGKSNKYKVIEAVEFKHGEEIGYVGDLSKALFEDLTDKAEADAAARKTEAEARAAAEAEAKVRAKADAEAQSRLKAAWDALSPEKRKEYDNDFAVYSAAVQTD